MENEQRLVFTHSVARHETGLLSHKSPVKDSRANVLNSDKEFIQSLSVADMVEVGEKYCSG